MAGRSVRSSNSPHSDDSEQTHVSRTTRSTRSTSSTAVSSTVSKQKRARTAQSSEHTPIDSTATPVRSTVSRGRVAKSQSSHTHEHRFNLEKTAANTEQSSQAQSKQSTRSIGESIKNLFARKSARNEIKRPRIVEDTQTGLSEPGSFVDANQLPSDDMVARTLNETAGTSGISTRPKVVNFAIRQKEQHKAHLRYMLRNTAIGVGVLAVIIAIVWLLFFSPVLRLQADRIDISGYNEWVSEQTIRDIADKQAGKSLLLVSTGSIEQQLSQIPGVSSAKASKQFPNGMEVSVEAQRPAAMLKAKGSDQLTAVDNQARILNSVDKQSVAGIPVIEVDNVEQAVKQRTVQSAVHILNALPESMRKDITAVKAQTQDSVSTTFSNGITVVWGDDQNLELKIAIVDKIMNDPNVIGDKKQINVSAPARPIIK